MAEDQQFTQYAQGSAIAQASYGGTAIVNVYQDVSARPVDSATLAAAQQQLEQLPLGAIPAIAPLPSGSHVPFAPNPLFVGRASHLRTLAAMLKDGGDQGEPRAKIAAITGLGGVGKTQLATEFVHRYGQYFAGGVFWLSFAEVKSIPAQMAECGRSGCLNLRPDFHALPLEDQIQLVLGAWQSALPRLLVFDNCEDEALVAQWSPPTGASRVLITSRRAQWDAMLRVKTLPLGELQLADSVQLLRAYIPQLQASSADVAAIATELGNLPLALHLAGSFLGKFHRVLTAQAYLAQLRSADPLAHSSLTKGSISATAHDENVSRTFEVSYRNLDRTDPTDAQALALLARATYFAPGEPIPHRLLLTTLESANTSDEALLQAESALLRLLELGLIEWVNEREGTLRMHRLLVKFLQQKTTDTSARAAVEQALAIQYEQIRNQSSPGAQRTSEMDQLVGQMRGFALQGAYTSADIQRIFANGTEGNRIVALALSFMKPDPLMFSSILEAIRNSRSAFEQYHALLAARALLLKLSDSQKGELVALLQGSAGTLRYIAQDTSRQIIRMSILDRLGSSAEAQYQVPLTRRYPSGAKNVSSTGNFISPQSGASGGSTPTPSQSVSGGKTGHTTMELLAPGTEIGAGRYTIEGVVTVGDRGAVYKARDTRFNRSVALKEILDEFEDENERVQAWLARETRFLRNLSHPCIPRVVDFFVDFFVEGSKLYFVMDFIEGLTLDEVLEKEGHIMGVGGARGLSEARARSWGRQLCNVLAYLHGQYIILRELQPSNVMVNDRDEIKLIDFGFAHGFEGQHQSDVPMTLGYIAPEQLQGVPEPRSDLYALGAILHRILTHHDAATNTPDIFTYPPVRSLRPDISPGFEQVIMKALAPLKQRWSDATEMERAIIGLPPVR
ncbi:MAG TPA: protein kinase [Ktedonobacteraceae bacterium]